MIERLVAILHQGVVLVIASGRVRLVSRGRFRAMIVSVAHRSDTGAKYMGELSDRS